MKKLNHRLLVWIGIIAILSSLPYIRLANVGVRQNNVVQTTSTAATNSSAGLQAIPSQLKNTDQEQIVKNWVDSETGQKLALTSKGNLSLSSSNGFSIWTTNILYLWLLRSTNHDYVIGTNGASTAGFFGDRIEIFINQTNIECRTFDVSIDRKTGACTGFVGE
jgi:hypothetical protein